MTLHAPRHKLLLIVLVLASLDLTLVAVPASSQTFAGTFHAAGTISTVWSDQAGTHECDWAVSYTWQATAYLAANTFRLSGTRTETVSGMVNTNCSNRLFPYDYVIPISVSANAGAESIQGVLNSGGFHETVQGAVVGTTLNGTWTQTFSTTGPLPTQTWTQSFIVGTFTLQPSSSCGIVPSGQSFTAGGGQGSFLVTNNNCTTLPAATTPDSWVTLLPGPYVCVPPTSTSVCPQPPASGSVHFVVAKNPTTSGRTGQIFVAGQVFSINQAGVSPACSFAVFPDSDVAPAAGGPLTPVNVVAPRNCSWTATVDAGSTSALHVTSGASGLGNGIVYLSANSNSGTARTLTATIAGLTFPVQQSAGAGGGLVCGATDVSGSVTITKRSFTPGWPGGFGLYGHDGQTIAIRNNTSSALQNLWLVLHNIPYIFPPGNPNGADYALSYAYFPPNSIIPWQYTACFSTTPAQQMIFVGNIGPGQTITVGMTFAFANNYQGHGISTTTVLSGAPNK